MCRNTVNLGLLDSCSPQKRKGSGYNRHRPKVKKRKAGRREGREELAVLSRPAEES